MASPVAITIVAMACLLQATSSTLTKRIQFWPLNHQFEKMNWEDSKNLEMDTSKVSTVMGPYGLPDTAYKTGSVHNALIKFEWTNFDATKPYTWGAYVKFDAGDTDPPVFDCTQKPAGSSFDKRTAFWTENQDQLWFNSYKTGDAAANLTCDLTPGQWKFIGVTFCSSPGCTGNGAIPGYFHIYCDGTLGPKESSAFAEAYLEDGKCLLGYRFLEDIPANAYYGTSYACVQIYQQLADAAGFAEMEAACSTIHDACSINCKTETCKQNVTSPTGYGCDCQTGWELWDNCTMPECDPTCSNGGTCIDPDVCSCLPGWTDLTCTTYVCTMPCQNGGSCTGPNTCQCTVDFTGPTCDTALCNPPCANGGTCDSYGNCTCTALWEGDSCELLKCIPDCINGGTCNNGTCACTASYAGSYCQIPVCSPLCANNGTCVDVNVCNCTQEWEGATCEEHVCDPDCMNGGNCTDYNVCTCADGYTGPICETAVCDNPCENNGTCTAPNTCTCINGWFGAVCTNASCGSGCLNGGECIAPDLCNCTAEWEGNVCHLPICTPACVNGNCTLLAPSFKNCSCWDGWEGIDCTTPICTQDCVNNGTCVAPDTCACTALFDGPTCELPRCTPSCKNGGSCIAPDTCQCTTEYFGNDCGLAHCTQNCLHGGNCTAPDVCTCTANMWTGTDCSEPVCVPTCENGGVCVTGSVCSCPTETTGSRCETWICDPACVNGNCSYGAVCSCEFGYTGPVCTIDHCFPPCQNGATCSAGYCTCTAQWTGTYCDAEICSPECQNGGSCVNQACQCTLAYTGSVCDQTCAAPCDNGGACIAGVCDCAPGWAGSTCQTSTCTAGFCKNGGVCSGINICTCPARWTGNNCTTPKCTPECVSGYCADISNTSKCVCNALWEGDFCHIPICDPTCLNDGICKNPGGDSCYCPNQWTGDRCTDLVTKSFPGRSAFQPDGSATWNQGSLSKYFMPETVDISALSPETCCPCDSFIMDSTCYFIKHLQSYDYLETPVTYENGVAECVKAGGTLASFPSGNSQQKLAAFFSWLGSDILLNLKDNPVDYWDTPEDMCVWLGIYRDNIDSKWYWETMGTSPVEVAQNLWIEYQDMNDIDYACVVPHKSTPMLRTAQTTEEYPVLCQIKSPCSQQCRPGSTRVFDRCFTGGSGTPVDRLTATASCTADGGTLSSVREQFEFNYWANGVYDTSLLINNTWIGYNHLTSDYAWESASVNLEQPMDVFWDSLNSQPDDQTNEKCAIASSLGWRDEPCVSGTARQIGCQSYIVQDNQQPSTFAPSTAAAPTTTAGPTSTVRPSYCEPECPGIPDCGAGWHYSSCFDSCYYISTDDKDIVDATEWCVLQDSVPFVPNTEEEFNMMFRDSGWVDDNNIYFAGTINWARRGGTASVASASYVIDPDDEHSVWDIREMILKDFVQVGRYKGSNIFWDTGTPFDYKIYSPAGYDWIYAMPETAGDFAFNYFYYEKLDGTWLMRHLSTWLFKRYICEKPFACKKCPAGWRKYWNKCYKYTSTWNYADWHTWNCQNQTAYAGYDVNMMTPKTVPEIALVSYFREENGPNLMLGLKKTASGWQWDGGQALLGDMDPMAFCASHPVTTTTGTYIHVGRYGRLNSCWRSTPTGCRTWCQMDAPLEQEATTTTTSTTTTTTSCMDGCCPCGFKYNSNNEKCYQMSSSKKTRADAIEECTKLGGYLATPTTQEELQNLFSDANYVESAYWTSLSKNAYGDWQWSDGTSPTSDIIAAPPLKTDDSCYGAIINKAASASDPQGLVEICPDPATIPSAYFSGPPPRTEYTPDDDYHYICEIASPCEDCKIPLPDVSLVRSYDRSGFPSPLRVSPTKCIWVFDETTTEKSVNADRCTSAGMEPLSMTTRYENEVMKSYLSSSSEKVWLDLVLAKNTPYTWDGEPTSYNRLAATPTNTWQQPCGHIERHDKKISVGSCINPRYPMCTIPSAESCQDLCPVGFTFIQSDSPSSGTCVKVVLIDTADSPADARQLCFDNYGTYQLAAFNDAILLERIGHVVRDANAADGSEFWIGLDNSLQPDRPSHSTLAYAGDPDSTWLWDSGATVSNSWPTFWAASEPDHSNGYAYATYHSAGENVLVSTMAVGTATKYFICERPKPCTECEDGWTFFNGHCYKTFAETTGYMSQFKSKCDFYNSYLLSIGHGAEDSFVRNALGIPPISQICFAGLYRAKPGMNNMPLTWFEWDDGTTLADGKFTHFLGGEPNYYFGPTTEPLNFYQGWNRNYWIDVDYRWLSHFGVCEKEAKTRSYQCPSVGSSPASCGENVISSMYVDLNSGFVASSYNETNPPKGMAINGNPWIPWSSDTSPWLKVTFQQTMYVRAVATFGAYGSLGMVIAYSLQYSTTAGSNAWEDLYVHRSTSCLHKGSPITFAGNAIATVKNAQDICPRRVAQEIKFTSLAWVGLPVVRLEVKGCTLNMPVSTFCSCWNELQPTENNAHWTPAMQDSFPFALDYYTMDTGVGGAVQQQHTLNQLDPPSRWNPTTADGQNWFMIKFRIVKVLTGLVMTGSDTTTHRIISYNVMWSHTAHPYTFNYYMSSDSNPRLFAGPHVATAQTFQSFCPPIKGKGVIIIPVEYDTSPRMTVAFFGCAARGKRCFDCCDEVGLCNCFCPVGWSGMSCSTVATDRSYYIDAQPPTCENNELTNASYHLVFGGTGVTASSYLDANSEPKWGVASLDAAKAWKPLATDTRPYWQVDFGRPFSITVTVVAGNGVDMVKTYAVWFRVPHKGATLFYPVLNTQSDPTSGLLAIPGVRGTSPDKYVRHYFCPVIRTDILRFEPIEVTGSVILRFMVYGCPPHAPCSTCCTNADGCQCKCPIGYQHNMQASSAYNPWEHCELWSMRAIDCEDLAFHQPNLPSGIYTIYPPGSQPLLVYCEMTAYGGGWTVFQQRVDKTQDFYLTWADYKAGFGNFETNFWLGNDKIHQLTAGTINRYALLIDMKAVDDSVGIAHYDHFWIENEAEQYKLKLGTFTCGNGGDSLTYHKDQPFSTKDIGASKSCAKSYYGAWWYKGCHHSNLNGIYGHDVHGQGVNWKYFRGQDESLKFVRMMVRRSPLPYSIYSFRPKYQKPVDCEDILQADPNAGSKVYRIYPPLVPDSQVINVFCDMAALGGGWTSISRHYDASVNFNRNWNQYANGFGDIHGNYYLGNEWIHKITDLETTSMPYKLAVVMEDKAGERRTAYYNTFKMRDVVSFYKTYFRDYDTNHYELPGDSLVYHDDIKFRTYDNPVEVNPCVGTRAGGWFFERDLYQSDSGYCLEANPNGNYDDGNFEKGMTWVTWKGRYEPLKVMNMMIKRLAPKPLDCEDVLNLNPSATDGSYWVYPYNMEPLKVYCQMQADAAGETGWTVIQLRHYNTTADFHRTWADYRDGFGDYVAGETDFWLGNDHINELTSSAAYSLRVTLRLDDLTYKYALYEDFRVSDASDAYRLFIQGYKSASSTAPDSFNLNENQFTTKDVWATAALKHCVNMVSSGGWWYNDIATNCMGVNLNAKFNSTSKAVKWNSISDKIIMTQMAIKRKVGNNVLRSTTTQLCSAPTNLNILRHECLHSFQQTSGDNIRLPVPSYGVGVYSGSDIVCAPYPEPQDCSYVQKTNSGAAKFMSLVNSGNLYTPSTGSFTAFCDQETMGGGWTVMQRRVDNTQPFQQDMTAYDLSFGSYTANFWLGNTVIKGLTEMAKYELLVEVVDDTDSYAFALYDLYYTTSSVYVLHLSGYQSCSTAGDSLTISNGNQFVIDECQTGGWWRIESCRWDNKTSNLNAPYTAPSCQRGIYWWSYADNFCPQLAYTAMKLRRPGTHGRYVQAANFSCAQTLITQQTLATETLCTDFCTTIPACMLAVYNRSTTMCSAMSDVCRPEDGLGEKDLTSDTYFRVEGCQSVSDTCGPPPSMIGTYQQIVDMPANLSVNYTCRPGYTNSFWVGDWTVLTCDHGTKRWVGRWLGCQTLCGDYPILPNANMLPDIHIKDGWMTLTYECNADYEWVAGDLTRVCEPPAYGVWQGDPLNCTSTKCPWPPAVSHSTYNISGDPPNRRYTVLNYTCDKGYLFEHNLERSSLTTCLETRKWLPSTPGTCVVFRCGPTSFVDNCDISPDATAAGTIWEFRTNVLYRCRNEQTIDPLDWDNNVTISCVGNNTWGVVDYVGPDGPRPTTWLPTLCKGFRAADANFSGWNLRPPMLRFYVAFCLKHAWRQSRTRLGPIVPFL